MSLSLRREDSDLDSVRASWSLVTWGDGEIDMREREKERGSDEERG